MQQKSLQRRAVLGAAVGALAGTLSASGAAMAGPDLGLSRRSADAIRGYYAAWEQKDWQPFDALLAEDFTFSSANDDDHISKSAFKKQCWETQVNYIKRFDLLHVMGSGEDAFVMYVCHTANGKEFRNVEYLRLRDGRVQAIECYFGAKSSFASAVSTG